jgi:hypothetical protein
MPLPLRNLGWLLSRSPSTSRYTPPRPTQGPHRLLCALNEKIETSNREEGLGATRTAPNPGHIYPQRLQRLPTGWTHGREGKPPPNHPNWRQESSEEPHLKNGVGPCAIVLGENVKRSWVGKGQSKTPLYANEVWPAYPIAPEPQQIKGRRRREAERCSALGSPTKGYETQIRTSGPEAQWKTGSSSPLRRTQNGSPDK